MTVRVKHMDEGDLKLLDRAFPFGVPDKHSERMQRQQRQEVLYLIAWCADEPVGHGLLKWDGASEEHIARYMNGSCPDVEDLYVVEKMRSKGVGRQILHYAEYLARERGYPQIGLSVGVENERARMLYERMGYKATELGEHCECGEYVDSDGQTHTWEERCIYLTKKLGVNIEQ